MKIVHAVNSLSAGGAEQFVASLSCAQKLAGHDVTLLCYAGVLDGIRPDVVHSHLEQSDLFVALALLGRSSIPVHVRTLHNVYASSRIPLPAHKWLAERIDCSVACGGVVQDAYPYGGSRICRIDNGVDIVALDAALQASRDTQCESRQPGRFDLISVGAFALRNGVLQKGQDILVDAIALLRDPRVHVRFLGAGSELDRIVGRSEGLGIHGQVEFKGHVENVAPFLTGCEALVMASRFEGLSIACIEAACAGIPLILPDIPAFRQFGGPGTMFFQAESPAALSDCLKKYVLNSSAVRRAAATAASSYRNQFDIVRVAQRYVSLYEAALAAKAGGGR
jgi:glycosyltransferase involved in cell wall biosynthesis